MKRLNLLKALTGRKWGANSDTILYSYRTFIRPLIEYSAVLIAHTDQSMLKKMTAIETHAIKLAFDLPPWSLNTFCYDLVTFPPITDRLKKLAKQFVEKNTNDFLLKTFIETAKPSSNGTHSPIYRALNW